MLGLEHSWLALLIDVSVKSLALAALALTTLTVFRVRNVNVRHRVWTAVLLAMIALPIMVPVTPAVPIPAWLIPRFADASAANPMPEQPADIDHPILDAVSDEDLRQGFGEVDPWHLDRANLPQDPFDEAFTGPTSSSVGMPVVAQAESQSVKVQESASDAPVGAGWKATTWLRVNLPAAICITYLAVGLAFLARIGVGLFKMSRIVARSRPIGNQIANGGVASRVRPRSFFASHVERRIVVRESAQLRVPLTIGFLAPKILLPADWHQWTSVKLHNVLAHETEHIRRGDYLVTLLAELNRAVHWFHPLAWLLRRWLSELAEQNCDDAVIASTGKRTQYARHLLEVANSLREQQSRVAWSGIAMARKPNVETRIDAILDAKRPLARRVGLVGGLLLVAITVPAVLFAAALRPESPTPPARDAAASKDDETSRRSAVKKADNSASTQKTGDADATQAVTPHQSELKKTADLAAVISGKVLGVDGQPFAGAKVYVEHARYEPGTRPPRRTKIVETTSGPTGEFTLDLGSGDVLNEGTTQVVAFVEGLGPAAANVGRQNMKPTLQLVDDLPIDGRIVDTEGQPIEGVAVRVLACIPPKSDEAVAEWIANQRPELFADGQRGVMFHNDPAVRQTAFPGVSTLYFASSNEVASSNSRHLPLPTRSVTDADGRFRFTGLGRNRKVLLELSGPSVAKDTLTVVTRQMKPFPAYSYSYGVVGEVDPMHYGAKVTFVARPTQPIVGTVRDEQTRQPLTNTKVRVNRLAGSLMSQGDFLTAMTDEQGRFRIEGAPHGGGHHIAVVPESHSPYFETSRQLPQQTTSGPIECNFVLPQAVWIVGTVTDDAGKPVHASVHYYPYRDNEFAQKFSNYDPRITGAGPDERIKTDADGTFRIQAIPGRGIVAAHVTDYKEQKEYLANIPADLLKDIGGDQMPRLYNPWSAKWFHAMRSVDIDADASEVAYHLTLKKGASRTLELVDTDGRPLTGVRVMGRVFPPHLEEPLKSSRVEIIGLGADYQRLVVLLHEQRKLGATLMLLATDERSQIQLQPVAQVLGRVVDDEGQPVNNVEIRVSPRQQIDNWGRDLGGAKTDADGRFKVLLPPGSAYFISAYAMRGPNFTVRVRPESGAIYDLADVEDGTDLDEAATARLIVPDRASKPPTASEIRRTTGRLASPKLDEVVRSGSTFERHRVHGQVVGSDGRGRRATVYVVSKRGGTQTRPGPERILHRVVTDASGRFDFQTQLPVRDDLIDLGVSHARVEQLVATADGYGPAVSPMIGVREGEQVTLHLAADDVPIEGQILNLEGVPIENASIKVAVLQSMTQDELDKSLTALRERTKQSPRDMFNVFMTADFLHTSAAYGRNELVAAQQLQYSSLVRQDIRTDSHGRFRLEQMGRDRIIALELSGPGIVTSWITVVSRPIEPIKASYFIGGRTNTTYGSRFIYSAEPAQIIEGVITDLETGQPIPGVQVESARYDSSAVASTTDDEGRYRLDGMPKDKRHHLTITPSADSPYFAREFVDVGEVAKGLGPTRFDLQLRKAQWVSGRVINKVDGTRVRARVVFLPHVNNQHAATFPSFTPSRMLEPNQTLRGAMSDEDGRFRVRAIPGEGLLVAICEDPGFCTGAGAELLAPQWFRSGQPVRTNTFDYAWLQSVHHLKAINVVEADSQRYRLEVDPGQTIAVQMTDDQLRPLDGVLVKGRVPTLPQLDYPLKSSLVEIRGVDPESPRVVFFYHQEHNLGAHLVANQAHDEQLTLKLQPCASIRGQLVDNDGNPLAHISIGMISEGMPEGTRPVQIARTDKQGRFESTRMIPGLLVKLQLMYLSDDSVVQIGSAMKFSPAESVDLGTQQVDVSIPRSADAARF